MQLQKRSFTLLYPKALNAFVARVQDDKLGEDQTFRIAAIVQTFSLVILNPGLIIS